MSTVGSFVPSASSTPSTGPTPPAPTDSSNVKRIRKLPMRFVDHAHHQQIQMSEMNSTDPSTISLSRPLPANSALVRNGSSVSHSHPQAVYSMTRIGPGPVVGQSNTFNTKQTQAVRRPVYVQSKTLQLVESVHSSDTPFHMQPQQRGQGNSSADVANDMEYSPHEYVEREELVEEDGEVDVIMTETETMDDHRTGGQIPMQGQGVQSTVQRRCVQSPPTGGVNAQSSVRYRAIIRPAGINQQSPQHVQYAQQSQSRSPFKVPYIPKASPIPVAQYHQRSPKAGFVSKGLGTSAVPAAAVDVNHGRNSPYLEGMSPISVQRFVPKSTFSSPSRTLPHVPLSVVSNRLPPRSVPSPPVLSVEQALLSSASSPSPAASTFQQAAQLDDLLLQDSSTTSFGAQKRKRATGGRAEEMEQFGTLPYEQARTNPESLEEGVEGEMLPPRPVKSVDLGCGELIERVPSPVLFPYSIPGAEKKTHEHQVLLPGTKLKTFRTDLEPDDVHLVNELGKLTPELLSKYIRQLLNKAVVLGEDQEQEFQKGRMLGILQKTSNVPF